MLIIVMADTIISKALSKELFILRVLIPVNRNIQNNKAEIPVLNSNEFFLDPDELTTKYILI